MRNAILAPLPGCVFKRAIVNPELRFALNSGLFSSQASGVQQTGGVKGH